MGKKTWIGIIVAVLVIISFVVIFLVIKKTTCKPDYINCPEGKVYKCPEEEACKCPEEEACNCTEGKVCNDEYKCTSFEDAIRENRNTLWSCIRKDPENPIIVGSFTLSGPFGRASDHPGLHSYYRLTYAHTINTREIGKRVGNSDYYIESNDVVEWVLKGVDSSGKYFMFVTPDDDNDETVMYVKPAYIPYN